LRGGVMLKRLVEYLVSKLVSFKENDEPETYVWVVFVISWGLKMCCSHQIQILDTFLRKQCNFGPCYFCATFSYIKVKMT